MRRRPSIRATAAAVLLLLATTASGAVNAASAPVASGQPNDERGSSASTLQGEAERAASRKRSGTATWRTPAATTRAGRSRAR